MLASPCPAQLRDALGQAEYSGKNRLLTFQPSPRKSRNGQVQPKSDKTPVINPCRVLRERSRQEFSDWIDNIAFHL